MSAERLREAAKWMRKRAERAPEGPYGMTPQWTTPTTMLSRVTSRGGVVAEVRERHGFHGVYTVDYFSYMHPAVALAVADLLDVWAEHDLLDSSGSLADEKAAILALVDAYLGDPS